MEAGQEIIVISTSVQSFNLDAEFEGLLFERIECNVEARSEAE